jgi:phosphonate transport system substrate-binding protein
MTNRFLLSAAVAALLSVACGSTPAPAEAPVKQDLVMAFVPSQNRDVVQTNGDILAKYLTEKTGYNIKAVVLNNYSAVTEGMTSKNVDIAWVGPLDYVVAHKINGAEVMTKSVRCSRDTPPVCLPSYKAFIIANVNSNINSVSDLRGKKFVFGDTLSTSSNLWPRYVMKKNGLDPDKDVTRSNISNQTQIAITVCQGAADAGAIYDDARTNSGAATSCPGIMQKTKIVATTDPPIPGDPQMIRQGLNSAQKQKVKDTFVAMGNDPEMKKALKALYTIDGLVPAQDSDYQLVRDIVQQVRPDLLSPTPSPTPTK